MSDYFANLAARARDTRTAIRPRLPKQFEPAAPRAAPTPQLDEVALEAGGVAEDVPAIVSQAQVEAPTAQSLSQEQQERWRPGLPVPPAPPQMETNRKKPPALSHVNIPNERVAQQPSTTLAPIASGGAADPTLAPCSSIDERVSFVTRQAILSATALPLRSPEPERSDLATSSVPISDTAATSLVEPVPVPPQAPTPPAPLNRRELKTHAVRAVRAPLMRRELAAAAETTVHVSIGRIELRVPPAAPPRKRERTSSPVAPLSDYLQQHVAARKRS